MPIKSATVFLLVYQPPIRKSVVLYTLSVGLLRAFMNSLLVFPYLFATAYVCKAFGEAERKPRLVEIKIAASKVDLR